MPMSAQFPTVAGGAEAEQRVLHLLVAVAQGRVEHRALVCHAKSRRSAVVPEQRLRQ